MMSRLTLRLIVLATFVDSILAGTNVNRALVEMPAWQKTGPRGWAAFSRHADLGPTGMFLYPFAAFAGAILSLAAAVRFHLDGGEPRAAALPLQAAVLSTIAGLLTTIKAAPFMLGIRNLDDDATALQQALDGFQFWGNVRGVFQVLAFVANLWSLLAILEPRRTVR